MGRFGFAAVTIASLWLLAPGGTADAFEARNAQSGDAAAITDISAQSRQRRAERRANLRIIVRPPVRRSPLEFNVFPRPEPYDWPGPGFVRDCVGWLEPEWRLSGTVIVPRRRCAWVRG